MLLLKAYCEYPNATSRSAPGSPEIYKSYNSVLPLATSGSLDSSQKQSKDINGNNYFFQADVGHNEQ